jgi:hypothetical protein
MEHAEAVVLEVAEAMTTTLHLLHQQVEALGWAVRCADDEGGRLSGIVGQVDVAHRLLSVNRPSRRLTEAIHQ